MTTQAIPGMLVALNDAHEVAQESSRRIARALREAISARGRATLALSGGETPKATYALLAAEPDIDWTNVRVFWVDERAVAPTHPHSNYGAAKAALLDAAHVPHANVFRMPADAPDLERAAKDYAALLASEVRVADSGLPGFDVMVLGVGDDGHTASLFPNHPAVHVTDRTVLAIGETPGREPRLTLSVPVIERARNVFVLAVGAKKTPALERVWSTTGTLSETPARVIRGIRGPVLWVIDKAAGGFG